MIVRQVILFSYIVQLRACQTNLSEIHAEACPFEIGNCLPLLLPSISSLFM